MSEAFEEWLHKMRPIHQGEWCAKQTYNFSKAAWNHQQKKIDEQAKRINRYKELERECLATLESIANDPASEHNMVCEWYSELKEEARQVLEKTKKIER